MDKKSDKTEEKKRIEEWLYKLNAHNSGWVNGDKEQEEKSADFVNHDLKIAIELKREKGDSLYDRDKNSIKLSSRISNYIKKTNEKFRNYPEYKTICLIEFSTDMWSVNVVLAGIKTLHLINGTVVGESVRNKKLFSESENIGGVILWPGLNNLFNEPYYFENQLSKESTRINIKQIEKIIGNKLKSPQL